MQLLVLPILAIVVLTVHDIIRRPTLRRLAFRNANRRRGEALLVLVGMRVAPNFPRYEAKRVASGSPCLRSAGCSRYAGTSQSRFGSSAQHEPTTVAS